MKRILRKGFTLIEMVMVLVLVGTMAALAIPRFASFYSIKLDGSIKKVAADIRYCQQMAVSRHDNSRIVFSAANDIYTAEEQLAAGGGWSGLTDPFTRVNLIMNFRTDPQYKGIDITSANFNSSSTLQFDWQGVPVSGGSVTFSYMGNSRTIIVANNTGRVIAQ
jgi:prepilin-type N-terminal cleavage/methylation domain-containing protein